MCIRNKHTYIETRTYGTPPRLTAYRLGGPKNAGYLSYYCINKSKLKCPGQAVSDVDGSNFQVRVNHVGHSKALQYHKAAELEDQIIDICLNDMSLPVSATIDDHMWR